MRNGTLPIPDKPEPPIYFAEELWFALLFIFATLLGFAIGGFFFIDGGSLNDCTHMVKATSEWVNLCVQVNNDIYTLFTVLGTIVSVSAIMYFISKRYNNKNVEVSR